MRNSAEIKDYLDLKLEEYNIDSFIETDPIQIPKNYKLKEDIEISAFLTSTIAWGNRTSIIKSAKNLMKLMDDSPYDFVKNSNDSDLKKLTNFKYRTFNADDLLFFIYSLKNIYTNYGGLESVFTKNIQKTDSSVYNPLVNFRRIFFELEHLRRTEKHVANVEKKSAAKRINMFLRWMVRKDIIDFGIWNKISTNQLLLPLDVHSGNVSRDLGLLKRKQNDWNAVVEITNKLKEFDPNDPVKYDYALFGIGAFKNEKIK
ncbi:MAG: TIGR02757 family protein [Marinifilaceae bacterium]|jgi:uncharacterized protein (TIGR02757 family)|nr:TIGR02757 family protein [Marinifilaceae bacterium]